MRISGIEKIDKQNISGYKGISFINRRKPWKVRITVNGKLLYIGTYATLEEAKSARLQAEITYHGEFRFHSDNEASESETKLGQNGTT